MLLWDLFDADKVFLILLVLILSVTYLHRQLFPANFPPGPRTLAFPGKGKHLQTRPHVRFTQFREKYGDVYSVPLGSKKAVVVCSLPSIREGLVKRSMQMSGRPTCMMRNMFACQNPQEGMCRANLSMNFNIKKEFTLRSLDNTCCSPLVENIITREVESLAYALAAQEKPADLSIALGTTFLRLMLYIVNGKLYQANDDNFLEIWRTYRMDFEVLTSRWDNLLGFSFLKQNTYTFTQMNNRTILQYAYQRDIVNRHKDCFNPSLVGDIVDHALVMLEQNDDMGVLNQEELDSLFVELSGSGHRPLTAVMLWFILYLSYFPQVQDKMYEELISVVGKGRLPKLEDQPRLPYTCAVILETQRLASVMPFLYPHLTTEETRIKGFTIPKDTAILFNVWSLHHDTKQWKHPMKFDPDRFLDKGELRIPDHFLPFGDGIRACPGDGLADIFLFLFASILTYHLKFSIDNAPNLEGDFKGYILMPKPYFVSVKARDTVDIRDSEEGIGEAQPNQSDFQICVVDYDHNLAPL